MRKRSDDWKISPMSVCLYISPVIVIKIGNVGRKDEQNRSSGSGDIGKNNSLKLRCFCE